MKLSRLMLELAKLNRQAATSNNHDPKVIIRSQKKQGDQPPQEKFHEAGVPIMKPNGNIVIPIAQEETPE